jgi:hypothetical protein
LIAQYGSVTIEQVIVHVLTYHGTPSWHAQNADKIYVCLAVSLVDEAKHKVALDALKVIVGLAHVDTCATVTVICCLLSLLDHKIANVQDNIIKLNLFVKAQQDALTARGEQTKDLLVNLFTAYMTCSDSKFLAWTQSKEDKYNKGKITLSPEELMTLADNKYSSLVESGKWMQESEEQKKIVALTAQVQSWEKVKANPGSKKLDFKKGNNKKGKKGKGKVINKPKPQEPAWVTVAPDPGQPHDRDVDRKDWHWCSRHGEHGKWVRHTCDKCKIKKTLEGKADGSKTVGYGASGNNKPGQMKVTAMTATYPEDDDF